MAEQNSVEITVSARIDGDLAGWFEDYRWTQRKLISDVVRDALIAYRETHPVPLPEPVGEALDGKAS